MKPPIGIARLVGGAVWLLTLFTSCGIAHGVGYIVPDGYQGYLAIEFDCAGGTDPIDDRGTFVVTFDPRGYACLAVPYTTLFRPGIGYTAFARSTSGNHLCFIGPLKGTEQGHCLIDRAQSQIVHYENGQPATSRMFHYFWTGDVGQFNQLTTQEQTDLQYQFTQTVLQALRS